MFSQLERIEHLRGGLEIVGAAARSSGSMLIHSQPPQVSTLTSARPVFSLVSAPFQSSLSTDVGALAVEAVASSRGSRRRTPSCALPHAFLAPSGVSTSRRPRCDRRCGKRGTRPVRRARRSDRVVEDVVGEVVADLGNLFDAADLLPDLAPQLVALGAGVVFGDVGLDADGDRFGELFGRSRSCRLRCCHAFLLQPAQPLISPGRIRP